MPPLCVNLGIPSGSSICAHWRECLLGQISRGCVSNFNEIVYFFWGGAHGVTYTGDKSREHPAVLLLCVRHPGAAPRRTRSQDTLHSASKFITFAFSFFFKSTHLTHIHKRGGEGVIRRGDAPCACGVEKKQQKKDPPSASRGSRKLVRFTSCSSPMHHLSLVRSPVIHISTSV